MVNYADPGNDDETESLGETEFDQEQENHDGQIEPPLGVNTTDAKPAPLLDASRDQSELQHILTNALIQVGSGDDGAGGDEYREKVAKAITTDLNQLYIRTPDQLKEALELPEVFQEITSGGSIKGMLLPAIRTELKNHIPWEDRANFRTSWNRLLGKGEKGEKGRPDSSRIPPMNKPLLRRLDVVRVDVTHLAEIDQVSQTFYARLFIILRIKDGAKDPNLVREYDGFPFDEHGRPTFRPSASWYLSQVDFPNGKNIRTIESKVTKEGDNLQLIKRIEGHFFERFELDNFPFDDQDLTVTMSANCACQGPVPVEFFVPGVFDQPPPKLGVDTANFAHADIWDLDQTLSTSMTTVGAVSSRRFPAIQLRAYVKRRCIFVVLNAVMPVAFISFLSLTTFFVPPEDTADRLELSITILLTAVAFKYTTSSYLPQISYLTLVDKFGLLCTALIVVVCLCHTVLGMLDTWVGVPGETLDFLNKLAFGVIALAWVMIQVWLLITQRRVKKRTIAPVENWDGSKRTDLLRRSVASKSLFANIDLED